jgi:hypothetical protein
MVLFMGGLSISANAQQLQVFDFGNAPYNATTKGYEQPNIGTYFKATGGGTVTFGTYSCDGYRGRIQPVVAVRYLMSLLQLRLPALTPACKTQIVLHSLPVTLVVKLL